MTRVIRGQVIASTATDRHGDRLDEDLLTRLFEQVGPDTPLGVHHDISQASVLRYLDKHLVRLESGELAITVDVEILDESTFAAMGGFSVSFTNLTRRYGVGEPQVRVLVNPRQFDFDETCEAVKQCRPAACFDVTELIQKADILATAVITVIVFAGLQFATGFLNAAGAHLFDALRRLHRRDQPGGPKVIQFHLGVQVGLDQSQLILVTAPELPASAFQSIDPAAIAALLSGLPPSPPADRIVVSVLPSGELRFDRVIMTRGS